MEMKRAHLWISGIVQGVFFRYSTRQKAEKLRVSGWVRNCLDGRVETVIEGEAERVNWMIEWCRTGPPHAHVTKVQIAWEEYQGESNGFFIRG
jgi:acylphosphatase